MRKSFLVTVVFSVFISLILYILKLVGVESLEWVTLFFCLGLIFGLAGLECLFTTIFNYQTLVLRKVYAFISVGFIAASLVFFSTYLGLETYLAIIFSAAILVGVIFIFIFLRPKEKWDEGDNHKKGYKTYRERMEEEEKQQKRKNK